MEDQTRGKMDELIDAIDDIEDVSVSSIGATEYARGDPTDSEFEPTGAEVDLTVYFSFDNDGPSRTDQFRFDG